MRISDHYQNLIKTRIHLFKTWSGQNLPSLLEKSAFGTWTWPYWFFFYGIIPLVLVIVPQVPIFLQYLGLSASASQDAFNLTFLLNFHQPTVISMFLMNYTHTDLLHLCGNLSVYILLITIIFVLEHNRRRFSIVSGYFLALLPFLVSIISILFFRSLPVHMVLSRGFSGIILAYYGYTIYLLLSLFQTVMFDRVNDDWRNAGVRKRVWILYAIVLISFGITFMIFLSGFVIGSFLTTDGTALGNGLAHFTGFMVGMLLPLVYELVRTRRMKVMDIVIIINIFFTLVSYSLYLAAIHG